MAYTAARSPGSRIISGKVQSTLPASLTSPPNPWFVKSRIKRNKDIPKKVKQQTQEGAWHEKLILEATNKGVIIIICKALEGHNTGRRKYSVRVP